MRVRIKKTTRIYMLLLMLLLFMVPAGAKAATAGLQSNIDTDYQCSLAVQFEPGQTTLNIYKIATMTPQGRYTLQDPFNQEPYTSITQINELNSDSEEHNADWWDKLATSLASYISTEGTEPVLSVTTDEDGSYVNNDMETGLYLILSSGYSDDSYQYMASPAIFSLPSSLDEEGSDWIYSADVTLKYSRNDLLLEAKEIRAVKVWDDDDDSAGLRPDSVTINLIGDGTVEDTQELNADNNWEYTFDSLDTGVDWTIQEAEVPDGYTVTLVSEEGDEGYYTYTITNTYEGDDDSTTEDTDETEDTSDDTTATTGTTTTTSGSSGSTSSGSSSTTSSALPQTGQLWWPVPFLCIGGLAAFIVGRIRRKRWNRYHNQ